MYRVLRNYGSHYPFKHICTDRIHATTFSVLCQSFPLHPEILASVLCKYMFITFRNHEFGAL